ncbi:MAG: hypothetical protein ACR2QK_06895 [Acidimicrobiales bacterium]
MMQTMEANRWAIGRRSLRLLVVLMAVDACFIVLHSTHVRYDVPGSGLWLISRDRGYPELFQYGKEATIVALLVALAARFRAPLYPAWAAVFTYLLIDDSAEVHETAGEALGEWLGIGTRFGIEQRDLGQILVSGMAGAVLLGSVGLAYLNDRSPARRLSIQLLVLVVGLAFFGIVTDVIDAIDLFGLVEDGGEMFMLTLMLVAVFEHREQRGTGQADPP